MSSSFVENHDSVDQITQSQQVRINSCSHRIDGNVCCQCDQATSYMITVSKLYICLNYSIVEVLLKLFVHHDIANILVTFIDI